MVAGIFSQQKSQFLEKRHHHHKNIFKENAIFQRNRMNNSESHMIYKDTEQPKQSLERKVQEASHSLILNYIAKLQ